MKKGTLKRFAATLMTCTMMVGLFGTSVMAEEPTGNVANNSVSVTFEKVLDMTEAEGASVPDYTFTYQIVAGEAVSATETTPEILAGVGNPVVGSADYNIGDSELTKTVSVDFSGVSFFKPGIYRYVITENDSTNPDITDDANQTRYLDVYVENADNNEYKIAAYVVLASAQTPTKNDDGQWTYGEVKDNSFENKYTTYELSLDKIVTGTMGDLTKEFSFTIFFEGPSNASFTYGNKTITLDDEGKESVNVKLADATEAVVIKGIPSTVKYTIVEKLEVKEGYTTSYKINEGKEIKDTTTGKQIMGKNDNVVECTNNKETVTPTGVILTFVPYIAMIVLAAAAFVIMRRRRVEF